MNVRSISLHHLADPSFRRCCQRIGIGHSVPQQPHLGSSTRCPFRANLAAAFNLLAKYANAPIRAAHLLPCTALLHNLE